VRGGTPLKLAGDLELTVAAAGADRFLYPREHVRVSAWLVDATGASRHVQLGTIALDGVPHRLSVDVADADSLLAVQADGAAGEAGATAQITVASGGTQVGTPLTVVTSDTTPQPRAVTVDGAQAPLPVIVSRALAQKLALRPGDEVAVRLGTLARPIDGRVAVVRDGIAGIGTGPAVAVDLDGLLARALGESGSVPAPGQLWARTGDIAATSAALRAVAERPVQIVTDTSIGAAAVIDPALALVASGIGLVALLAAAAFTAVSIGVVRARRDEALPLRSFGFAAARQRRAAAIELAATAAFALVLGATAGIIIALWLGPALTAALTIGGVP